MKKEKKMHFLYHIEDVGFKMLTESQAKKYKALHGDVIWNVHKTLDLSPDLLEVNMMDNITTLEPLYKRDSKGKLRIWEIQWGYTDDSTVTDPKAGTRTISGLVDGKKVTSGWNISEAKNVGRSNATTSITQAQSEAKSQWDIKAEKEYFNDVLAGRYLRQV